MKYRGAKGVRQSPGRGWLFGRGVPALVVMCDRSGAVEDVYPHERAGKLVTIYDFFYSLGQAAAQTGAVTLGSAGKRR